MEPLSTPIGTNRAQAKKPAWSKTTYRVRLPSDHGRKELSETVQALFEIKATEFRIHSLFLDISEVAGLSRKVATVSFRNPPADLSDGQDWGFDIPTITEESYPTRIYFDTLFKGFTPLTPAKNDGNCDMNCIFLHGWGGHAIGSFTWPGTTYTWMRDDLSQRFPKLRVWTYGYGSRMNDVNSVSTAHDLGKGLAIGLRDFRHNSTDKQNPMIFAVHSLGGLLFQEAIISMAKSRPSSDDQLNLQLIRGALFFGVPGQGMNVETLASMAEGLSNQYTSTLLDKNVGWRWRDSQEDAFLRAFPDSSLKLVQFYETRKTPVKAWDGKCWIETGQFSLLVEPHSAVSRRHAPDAEDDAIPLDKNHLDMVKFAENDVFDYRKVCNALGSLASDAHTIIHKRIQKQKLKEERVQAEEIVPGNNKYLESLAYNEMFDRERHVSEAEVATCTWLPSHSSYRQWLDNPCSILWIKGKPGAGKSTLLKYAYNAAQEYVAEHVLMASFFFHGRGSELQKSLRGLYRSLLYQIIQKLPGIRRGLDRGAVPFNFDQTQDHATYERQELELADVFEKCLLKAAMVRSLQIYIDALDECGVEAASKLIDTFRRVLGKVRIKHGTIKVCFSCRHYPEITINDGLDIIVEKENSADIRKYVDTQLAQLEGYVSAEDLLCQIVDKSNGVFQWTVFAVSRIVFSSRFGFDAKIVEQKINDLPSDLYALYESVLTLGPSYDKQRLLLLFQWAIFAREPLSLEDALPIIFSGEDFEPRFMYSIYEEDLNTYNEVSNVLSGSTYRSGEKKTIHPKIHSQVRNLSRGLIEIVRGYAKDIIQVIHHSVKDYLLDGGFSFLGAPLSTRGYSHFALSQSCLEYLNMQEIRNEILGELSLETDSLQNNTTELSSIRYASYLDTVPENLVDRVQFSNRSASSRFTSKDRSWEKVVDRGKYEFEPIPDITKQASIEWGENGQLIIPHVHAAWTLIESSTDKISPCTRRILKKWAFYRIAWRFPFFQLAVSEFIYHARLAQACEPEQYDWKTFSAILDSAADVLSTSFTVCNHFEGKRCLQESSSLARRTGLHIAAANGLHSSALWFCKEPFLIDAKDCYGQTALHIALYTGNKAIVDLLLDLEGVDIFTIDTVGNNLLHAATTGQLASVIPYLLASGIPVNERNGALETPLHKAMRQDSILSMILLLDDGADTVAEDSEGNTPLDILMSIWHWRSSGHYFEDEKSLPYSFFQNSLQLLVARGADTSGRPKSDSYGPIKSWLKENLENLSFEMVELLLKGGAKFDEEDEEGATILLQILKWPRLYYDSSAKRNSDTYLKTLNFMLLRGADIHRTLWDGSGVLLLAARLQSNQHFKEIMLSLLEYGANPNVKDETGATMLYESTCRLFNHASYRGRQPFKLADRKQILTSLISHGADVTVRDIGHHEPIPYVEYGDEKSTEPIEDDQGDDQGEVFLVIVSHAKDFVVELNLMQWSIDDNQAVIMEDAYVAGIYLDIVTLFLDAGAIVDPDESKYQDLFSVARKYARIDLVDRITKQSEAARVKQGLSIEPETHRAT